LPERLSADLCSLKPDADRLSLSVMADLDGDGNLHGYRFAETVIRSRHRLHYGEVQEALEGRHAFPRPLAHALTELQGLSRALRPARSRGPPLAPPPGAARAGQGALPGAGHRPLRARDPRVLPLHLADPALPRPPQPPAGARVDSRPAHRGVGSAGTRGSRR